MSLVRGKITPIKRIKLHKYLERNSKATALIERSPHCTIRRTVSNRGANEHAGNQDSGIDSQHPCTYERIGPLIGKISRSWKQTLGVNLRQIFCQIRIAWPSIGKVDFRIGKRRNDTRVFTSSAEMCNRSHVLSDRTFSSPVVRPINMDHLLAAYWTLVETAHITLRAHLFLLAPLVIVSDLNRRQCQFIRVVIMFDNNILCAVNEKVCFEITYLIVNIHVKYYLFEKWKMNKDFLKSLHWWNEG